MQLDRFSNWYGDKPDNISTARWRAMIKQERGARNARELTEKIAKMAVQKKV